MVTRKQLEVLERRIEGLMPDHHVTVAVFVGETPQFAHARHCERRPEHAGWRARFDYRPQARNELYEEFAVWFGATPEDMLGLKRLIDARDGESADIFAVAKPTIN